MSESCYGSIRTPVEPSDRYARGMDIGYAKADIVNIRRISTTDCPPGYSIPLECNPVYRPNSLICDTHNTRVLVTQYKRSGCEWVVAIPVFLIPRASSIDRDASWSCACHGNAPTVDSAVTHRLLEDVQYYIASSLCPQLPPEYHHLLRIYSGEDRNRNHPPCRVIPTIDDSSARITIQYVTKVCWRLPSH